MERIPVSSTNVGAIGYEPETSLLEVEFKNGSIYHYHGVPKDMYDSFMEAGSKGKFLNAFIKDRYACTKL